MAAQTSGFEKMRCASFWHQAMLFCLLCSMMQVLLAEDDPYLAAITAEAKKIDSGVTGPGDGSQAQGDSSEEDAARMAFEDDLKSRYMGSYTFYKKLPRRARDEVYDEYKGGVSVDEIRRKIMDRFLNQ
jgi:hypothetical protein